MSAEQTGAAPSRRDFIMTTTAATLGLLASDRSFPARSRREATRSGSA